MADETGAPHSGRVREHVPSVCIIRYVVRPNYSFNAQDGFQSGEDDLLAEGDDEDARQDQQP